MKIFLAHTRTVQVHVSVTPHEDSRRGRLSYSEPSFSNSEVPKMLQLQGIVRGGSAWTEDAKVTP